MDTSKIKKFAIEARNILIQGVAQRLVSLCFRPNGQPTEEPVRYDGGATFMGDTISVDFYDKWMSLKEAISNKGTNEVVEEAAYTWFNRLVAIRILARNEIISPVLEYESEGLHIPVIVSEARQGRYPRMTEQQETKLQEYLNDDSLTSDQFRLLIMSFCHSNPIGCRLRQVPAIIPAIRCGKATAAFSLKFAMPDRHGKDCFTLKSIPDPGRLAAIRFVNHINNT